MPLFSREQLTWKICVKTRLSTSVTSALCLSGIQKQMSLHSTVNHPFEFDLFYNR